MLCLNWGLLQGSYAFRNALKQNQPAVKCPRCWMIPRLCFCGIIAPIPKCHVDVVVYMHWKEASNRKASNTAKLVPMLLPGGTLVAVGDVEAEARMHHLLHHSDRAAILFPSPTADTIADWVAGFSTAAPSSPGPGPGPPGHPGPSTYHDDHPPPRHGAALPGWQPESRCTIVVLDGTWSDAKFLNKSFPATVPRVKLSAVPGELEKLRTRWAHPEKLNIQSFNAVIQAIEETGLSTDAPAATTVELTDKLRQAIEYYTMQTFKEKGHKAAMTRHVWEDAKTKHPGATLAELSVLMEKTSLEEEVKSER